MEKDFVDRVPFIFPQTNIFYIGKQKIEIPPQYFPQLEDYVFTSVISSQEQRKSIRAIKFLASIPNFSDTRQIFAKLPAIYNFSTNVSIFPLFNPKDLEKIFYISPLAKNEQIDSQYGLNKRVSSEKYLYHNPRKKIIYYQKNNGVTTTAIRCYPDLLDKMKCQHYFVYKNFIFSFKHRENDLKNWQVMQNNLIDKIESWQRE